MTTKAKIGLALGGGAILGAAHIGVLKAFDEEKISVSAISGTSIGAFVAALYAFGVSPEKIEKIALELDWLDISGFAFSRLGLLSNEKMGKKIDEVLGEVQFKDARIPLSIISTDIGRFEKVVLETGDVARAVMSSACVPGIFIPVEIDDHLLVDGGLMENVPISPLIRRGMDKIIGVDLNAGRKYKNPDDLIDVVLNSIDIAIDNATRMQTRKADLLIAPELSAYNRADSDRVQDLIHEGYTAARRMISKELRTMAGVAG
ncbi:MAG: patatin [Desulfobacteraceae bacterium]|jgi:NTE family protein|nr:MAG: patatin [Desulfobacteraceae bacterium]